MGAIINASIDLSKVDKSRIFEKDGKKWLSLSNDKKWLSLSISIKDETKYGNNVGIALSQSKEERDAKVDKTFIGNGKVAWTDGNIVVATKEETTPDVSQSDESSDDLPF